MISPNHVLLRLSAGALAAIGGLSMLLAGCAGDDDNGSSPPVHDGVPSGDEGTPTSGSIVKLRVSEIAGLGPVLVTADGHTLYTFANDTEIQSNCDAACAAAWPRYMIDGTPAAGPGIAGTLGTISIDGGQQLTYNGKPLYRFSNDAAPGQANGQGVDNVWFVAKP